MYPLQYYQPSNIYVHKFGPLVFLLQLLRLNVLGQLVLHHSCSFHDYFGLSSVHFKVDFLDEVPVVYYIVVEGLPLQTAVQNLPNEIVVRLFVELDRFDVVHQVDHLQRHLPAQNLGSQFFLDFLNVDLSLDPLVLNHKGGTSLALAQGSLPSLRYRTM